MRNLCAAGLIEGAVRFGARAINCGIRHARGFVVAVLTDAEVAADANSYAAAA